MGRARSAPTAAVVLLAVLGVATPAAAHPLVDEGQRLYEEAEFVAALAASDRAMEADDLSRADLIRVLQIRALVRFATGESDAMSVELARLAAVAPDFAMGAEVPPPVTDAFAEAREGLERPLRLQVTTDTDPGGLTLRARVEGDPGDLVRSVRLSARPLGGQWSAHVERTPLQQAELRVPASPGATVEHYAELIGPGGAVLLSRGTRQDPMRASAGAALGAPTESRLLEADEDEDDGTALYVLVGAGALLATAATVVAIVALGGSSDQTEFSPATLR